jgi:hypothetical protein
MIDITHQTTVEEWEHKLLLEMVMTRRLTMLPEHRKTSIVLPSNINAVLALDQAEYALGWRDESR